MNIKAKTSETVKYIVKLDICIKESKFSLEALINFL